MSAGSGLASSCVVLLVLPLIWRTYIIYSYIGTVITLAKIIVVFLISSTRKRHNAFGSLHMCWKQFPLENKTSAPLEGCTGCSIHIVFFFQEFFNVCHLSLVSTRLLLVLQKKLQRCRRGRCCSKFFWTPCNFISVRDRNFDHEIQK